MSCNSNGYLPSRDHEQLSVYVVTWNLQGLPPNSNVRPLLAIESANNGPNTSPEVLMADMYVIGLQEVSHTDKWIEAFDKVFRQLDYVRLKFVRMVATLMIVYTRKRKLLNIRDIESQYSSVSFNGYFGGKGGICVSLVVDDITLCLVNSHLFPHWENLDKRINDYKTIVDNQYFVSQRKPNIFSHDYVIWLGDLNFRIDDLTSEQIHDIICNKTEDKRTILLEKDQLNRVRREGRAFNEFTELVPNFAPTYKFFINTDNYDLTRKPAFTDRVLYRVKPRIDGHLAIDEDLAADIKQLDYRSHPQYVQSDHKPVSALFHIKTKRSLTYEIPLSVIFLPITDWKVNQESTAWYKIVANYDKFRHDISPPSQWDWIGLFKSDFITLEEHSSFVWANHVPTPRSDLSLDTFCLNEPHFSVQFSAESINTCDEFRLLYVSQCGNVFGISDPFLVSL